VPVLEARTTVHRPPEVVFDALSDLRRYEAYSTHLAAVERTGDGGVGTEYDLRFEWWRVAYAVRSTVTAVDRPARLDFEVVRGLAASGSWLVDAGAADGASRVTFVVRYDPDTVASSALQLPALTPISWVIDRVAPLVEREARGVVERVVRDLEGSERDVDLEVTIRAADR